MRVFNVSTRFVLIVTAVSFWLIAGGCAKTTINHFYGLGMNYADLKSYKWGPSSAPVPDGQYSLVDTNVQFIADQELNRKGYKKSSENPKFSISIVYNFEIDRSPYSYQLRMLTLNVYRAETEELIWRGTASGAINIDAASGELMKAVQGILATFPDISATVPKDAQLSDLGFKQIQQGNYAEAEKYLDQALSENPDNPYVLLNLGVVYQNTGRSAKARATYEKLITLNPPDVAVVSNKPGAKGKKLADIAKENLQNLH